MFRLMAGLGRVLAGIVASLKREWIFTLRKRTGWTGYKKTMAKWFSDEEIKDLDPKLVEKLSQCREIAGIPFIITSGKRYPGNNPGVESSAHLSGRAVDLRSHSSHTHFKIVQSALKAGFNRIGIYTDSQKQPSHVHLDIADDLPPDVLWIGESK